MTKRGGSKMDLDTLLADCRLVQHFVDRELEERPGLMTIELAYMTVRKRLSRVVQIPWLELAIDRDTGCVAPAHLFDNERQRAFNGDGKALNGYSYKPDSSNPLR